uniref:Uncharacterized protein n=1 Tax=Anguilla anguilla TaxID=7936 RepID=A0A0E9TN00_ANGAN
MLPPGSSTTEKMTSLLFSPLFAWARRGFDCQ